MTDLNVKRIAAWYPVCDGGRHVPPHPGDTCEEADAWIAHRDAWLKQHIGAAMNRALDGDHDGAMRVLLGQPEPTPIERALGILAPHLRREPLYRDR